MLHGVRSLDIVETRMLADGTQLIQLASAFNWTKSLKLSERNCILAFFSPRSGIVTTDISNPSAPTLVTVLVSVVINVPGMTGVGPSEPRKVHVSPSLYSARSTAPALIGQHKIMAPSAHIAEHRCAFITSLRGGAPPG